MLFGPLCQHQRDQLWSVVHLHFQRVAAACLDPVQHPDDSLSRDIQVDFYRKCFTVRIIHQIKGPEASTLDQRVVHKIDGPALV